jgi:GNAT superfamily N-acetyltransferase
MEDAAVRAFIHINHSSPPPPPQRENGKGKTHKHIDESQVIEMLSTHPDHKRRGAGSMLMKWGCDIADSLSLKAFVQATREGQHLYGKFGFVDNEGWITFPVSEKHSGKPVAGCFNLDRPAKALT